MSHLCTSNMVLEIVRSQLHKEKHSTIITITVTISPISVRALLYNIRDALGDNLFVHILFCFDYIPRVHLLAKLLFLLDKNMFNLYIW